MSPVDVISSNLQPIVAQDSSSLTYLLLTILAASLIYITYQHGHMVPYVVCNNKIVDVLTRIPIPPVYVFTSEAWYIITHYFSLTHHIVCNTAIVTALIAFDGTTHTAY